LRLIEADKSFWLKQISSFSFGVLSFDKNAKMLKNDRNIVIFVLFRNLIFKEKELYAGPKKTRPQECDVN